MTLIDLDRSERMTVSIEELALEMGSELHEEFLKIGRKYQKKGMPLYAFTRMSLAEVFSMIMQLTDDPRILTVMINDVFTDGIDGLDEQMNKKLKKFQRITAFCEDE